MTGRIPPQAQPRAPAPVRLEAPWWEARSPADGDAASLWTRTGAVCSALAGTGARRGGVPTPTVRARTIVPGRASARRYRDRMSPSRAERQRLRLFELG